jgi:hypothetical protein
MIAMPVCRPRVPKEPGVCDREPDESLETYDDVVDAYRRIYRDAAQAERQFFKDCSLQKAIRYAGLCKRPDGKRHGHHQRRSRAALAEAESVLQGCAEEMRGCDTFDDLHAVIHREIFPIRDIGDLVVYDVATWIGAHLGLNPERVYLHAGAAEGAKALGIRGRETVGRSELPAAFRRLRCCEAEDCLCIFKDDLARIARRSEGLEDAD